MENLDINEKLKVQYCIPTWLRDEQVKQSTLRIKGRIEPQYDKRTDPIALVAFGPSLNKTWEQIKDFKYIMTCSGSHKFLIDRGIIPTWQLEVDPRPHKVQLLGAPHPDVTYLASSSCHPKYFDWLEQHNANIKLWHVFDSYEEGIRVLPRGEWALTGGSSVGLRMFTMARFFGFLNFHVFGMDGNKGDSGSHADFHPNAPKEDYIVEYEGKSYFTTPSILQVAKETFRELDFLKDVTATFYGDGLVQTMAKNYVRKPPEYNNYAIGISKPELISEEYRALNIQLHRENLTYGTNGSLYKDAVLKLYDDIKAKSILDYGCGKGYLAKELPFPIWEYDPCVAGKMDSPRPADLVVCTDVLEHIEPDYLDFVLNDLQRCVLSHGYFVISMVPAKKTLSNGMNTHLIQQGREWWIDVLKVYFKIPPISIAEKDNYLYVIVTPLKDKQ